MADEPGIPGAAINCADLPPLPRALIEPAPPLRVLLTGATSQIGVALRLMLLEQDHGIIALSRTPPADADPGVRWRQADLDDGWPAVGAVDAVISFGPMQALADALAALDEAPCRRLVATSSMSAVSKRDSSVAEDRALSASLREAEAALIAQCERLGIGWTVLRPTMIYGLGIDRNISPVARRATRTRVFPYPRGRGMRQPVHAEDVALATWRALHRDAAIGRIIEIGGGERLRIDAMFRRVRAGLPAWTLPLPVPRVALALAAVVRPGLRGFASRIDQDLLADNAVVEAVLGVEPRGFAPGRADGREAAT